MFLEYLSFTFDDFSSASGNPAQVSAKVSSTWSRQKTLVILRLTLDPWWLFVQDDSHVGSDFKKPGGGQVQGI